MKMNVAIRNKAKESGVYLWEVAQELGIPENEFFTKLRKAELSFSEKTKILKAIEAVAERYKRV